MARRLKEQIPSQLRDFVVLSWETGGKLAKYEEARVEATAEMLHSTQCRSSNVQVAQDAVLVALKASGMPALMVPPYCRSQSARKHIVGTLAPAAAARRAG